MDKNQDTKKPDPSTVPAAESGKEVEYAGTKLQQDQMYDKNHK